VYGPACESSPSPSTAAGRLATARYSRRICPQLARRTPLSKAPEKIRHETSWSILHELMAESRISVPTSGYHSDGDWILFGRWKAAGRKKPFFQRCLPSGLINGLYSPELSDMPNRSILGEPLSTPSHSPSVSLGKSPFRKGRSSGLPRSGIWMISRGFEPWEGPTMPFLSMSSMRRAARL
jgi:hypothetical protein